MSCLPTCRRGSTCRQRSQHHAVRARRRHGSATIDRGSGEVGLRLVIGFKLVKTCGERALAAVLGSSRREEGIRYARYRLAESSRDERVDADGWTRTG